MRVAYVTTDLAGLHADTDRPLCDPAFARAGIRLEHPCWWDAAVDWAAYDLVLLRSPWDYSTRTPEFLAWLGRVERLAPVENPPALVRWNLDKRYLADLAARGVPVLPTLFSDDEAVVAEALGARGRAEVVIKPAVSAGSRNTGRFRADDPAAAALARRILAEGRRVMLQPFAASVGRSGETSLVLFDGALSHAFRKGPILAEGGGFLGGAYREDVARVEPSPAQRDAARRAEAAVRAVCAERFGLPGPLLYARFDLVDLDGSPALLEAELFEPSFFFHTAPESPARLAEAVRRRLAP